MFANQYRPNFIDTDEPLARDVEVPDFEAMKRLPWMRRWEDEGFKGWQKSGEIVSAVVKDGSSWVVGYLTRDRIWCDACDHWRTHCRNCGCGNAVDALAIGE